MTESTGTLREALKWALNHVVADEEMGAEDVIRWREEYAKARDALSATSASPQATVMTHEYVGNKHYEEMDSCCTCGWRCHGPLPECKARWEGHAATQPEKPHPATAGPFRRVWIVEIGQNGRVHSVHATKESAENEISGHFHGEGLYIGAPWAILGDRAPATAGEWVAFEQWFRNWCYTDEAELIDQFSLAERADIISILKVAWKTATAGQPEGEPNPFEDETPEQQERRIGKMIRENVDKKLAAQPTPGSERE